MLRRHCGVVRAVYLAGALFSLLFGVVPEALASRVSLPRTGLLRCQSCRGGGELVSEDPNGNKEAETDRRGVTRHHTWDALNRLVKTEIVSGLPGEGPLGAVAEYTYDLAGNTLTETDLAGLVTRFEYDGLYRVKAKVLPETMPAGRTPEGPLTERYAYDKVGNRLSVTDPNGHTTSFRYDGLNRLLETIDALGQTTTVTYDDPEGSHVNKSQVEDETRGLRTTYLYDALNREIERRAHLEGEDGDPAPGPVYTTSTAYDDAAHAMTVTDPRGTPTRTVLGGLDRVIETAVDPSGLDLVTRTSYDGLGNRKSLIDPNGHETRYRHDGLGRLVELTDARNQKTTYTYDGEGLKLTETDRRDVTRNFTYDNLGRPRRESLASSPLSGVPWSREIRYLDRERQRIETGARGHSTSFELDGLSRVVKETDALGFFRTFIWDGVNRVEETDKRERPGGGHYTTVYTYDELNRVRTVTNPLLQTVETTYEDALNRRTEADRRGIVTRTQLDPLGRVVSVTRALGTPDEAVLETNAYDGNDNLTLTTDAEARQTQFAYDPANRLEGRTDGYGSPEAATTTFVYDKAGNLLEERDPRAAELGEPWSVRRTYDELDRLETETNGEGGVTTFSYDPEGNRTSVQEPAGQITRFTYDERGALLTVTQPSPEPGEPEPVTSYVYDPNRNLLRMEDADSRVTKLDYDDLNRLFKTTRDPGGLNLTSTTSDFDEDGHPLRIAEANGEVTRQTWDELGRLETRTHEPPVVGWTAPWQYTTEERYFYDPNSNLERVEERDLRTGGGTPPVRVTTRGYDRLDRQTSETVTLQDGTTSSVTTEYWRDGRVKSVTDPRGATSYTYDGQGREETVTTSAGETRKTYYPDGLVKDITFPNLTKRAHGYDKADRLLTIVTTKDGAPVASTAYTYDPNGNRLTQVQANGGSEETTTYTYDDLDRLATVTYAPDAEHPNGRTVTYGHDGAGNRTSEAVTDPVTEAVLESKTGHFDNANRLTELTDNLDPAQTTTLGWDRNGNLLSETKAGVTTTYRYDLRDTLAEVERSGQTLARFLGDFDERRVLKIGDPTRPGGSGVQEYVYHGSRLILDVENGQPTARYEWTNEELISLLLSGGARRYFALDGLETVLALTDEQGQATDRLNFDAWGVPKEGTDFGPSGNRFAFTSHRFDTELGLYYAGGRMYSPTIGRFISQDTLSLDPNNPDTWNLFNYGRSNPTRYVDPTGHASVQAGRIEQFAELDLRILAGHDPTQPPAQVLESPREAHARAQARANPARKAKLEKAAVERLARLGQLEDAGFSHYANITIEESDFVNGRLDRARVLAAVEKHAGTYATSEAPGLADALFSRLQGKKAGETVDISELYSLGYEASAAKAHQVALAQGTAGGYAYMGALLGQSGAAPAEMVVEAGQGIVAGSFGDVTLALGGYTAVRGLAAAFTGFGRELATAARSSAAAPKRVPNPYGKLGSPAHQAKVEEVVADIRARGLRAETEAPIPTIGGAKDVRYMDVVAVDPATGKIVEVHQVGRVLKSDPRVPVARERAALRDVRRSPELRDAKRVFHEY